MINDRLGSIAIFVQAADAGGFTSAAAKLGLSRSAVAKSVGRLEERLGTRLINRTTRGFSLTSDGAMFYKGCLKALSELEGAEAMLAARRRSPTGKLRIDLPVVFGLRWIVPALIDIAQNHPRLELKASLTDGWIDPIDEGVDLLVRIGELPDSATMVARSLGIQASIVCASPSYLANHGSPRSISDLDAHECVTFNREGRPMPWAFIDADGGARSKVVRGRYSFNHSDAILAAAVAGCGLAHLATWLVAKDVREGRLMPVLGSFETAGFPIHLMWQQTRHLTPKVRVVVDELVRRFLPDPPWNSRLGVDLSLAAPLPDFEEDPE